MIEKMKFVSISGPKNDLDRMVNQYLSHYEIQLENALTELRSASKLEPYPGTNPYREPLQKAQKLLASCPGAKQQEISIEKMPVDIQVKKKSLPCWSRYACMWNWTSIFRQF